MNKKYEEFVGCLRDELMKCLGLGEKQIYFEERSALIEIGFYLLNGGF